MRNIDGCRKVEKQVLQIMYDCCYLLSTGTAEKGAAFGLEQRQGCTCPSKAALACVEVVLTVIGEAASPAVR